MSKNLKILLAVFGVALVAVVVLNMFNKPPKLPLGPLVGILAADEVVETVPAPAAGGGIIDPTTGLEVVCVPIAGAADATAGAGATDPATGAPAGTVDPATGAPAGTVDPATGAPAGTVDPATGAPAGTVDPATGAPVAAGAEGWSGDARVTAAGGAYDGSRISDTRIIAAEAAVDPATGTATAVPATGTQAAVPVTTDAGATDPATGLPAAGAADPAATAGAGAGANPCPPGQEPAKDAIGDAAAAGGAAAAAGGGDPAAGTTGAGATTAAPTSTKATTDGTNSGNSPEALRAAKDASAVMSKAKIQVSTTATLVPSVGGTARPAAMRRYRGSVTAAVLVMKLDSAAQQQWTGAGKKVQIDLVKSFLVRLRKTYPKASRSITVVNAEGNVLAIGDAVAGGGAGTVKLF